MSHYNDMVATEIRVQMTRTGMTQASLATRVEITRSTLGALVRGERLITVDALQSIATALGVEPAELCPRVGLG